MAVSEEYVLKLKADLAQAQKAFGDLQTKIKGADNANALLSKNVKALAIGLGGLFAAGKVIQNLKQATKEMDEMGKAAKRAGLSTPAFSELAYAAKIMDVEMGQLSQSLKFMQINLTEAASGSKQTEAAFSALGLSAKDLINLPANEQFVKIIESLEGVENAALRTKIAQDIFGKSSQGVLNIVNEGGDALRRYTDEARKFGYTISDEAAAAADEFNDSLTRLGEVWDSTFRKIANEGNLETATAGINGMTAALQFFIQNTVEAYGEFVKLLAEIGGADMSDFSVKGQAAELGKYAQSSKISIDKIEKERASKLGKPGNTQNDIFFINQNADASLKRIEEGLKIETLRIQGMKRKQLKELATNPTGNGTGIGDYSSGGSAKESKDPLTELLKGTKSAKLEELQSEIKLVNQGFDSGRITLTQQQEVLEGIRQEMDDLNKNEMQDFFDGMAEGLFSGVKSWDDFKRAGLNALAKLAEKATSALFANIFGGGGGNAFSSRSPDLNSSASGGSGGGISNFFSKIWSALPSFDGGGSTGGGMGGVSLDGKGGFPALLHPGESVKKGNSGMGAGVTQNVIINATNERDIDRRIMQALPRFRQETIMGVQQAMKNGGSLTKTIGDRL